MFTTKTTVFGTKEVTEIFGIEVEKGNIESIQSSYRTTPSGEKIGGLWFKDGSYAWYLTKSFEEVSEEVAAKYGEVL